MHLRAHETAKPPHDGRRFLDVALAVFVERPQADKSNLALLLSVTLAACIGIWPWPLNRPSHRGQSRRMSCRLAEEPAGIESDLDGPNVERYLSTRSVALAFNKNTLNDLMDQYLRALGVDDPIPL